MSYEFALDKKALISVIAGWVVIGLLLFFSGWIVGRQWPMSETASTQSATAKEQRAELPIEPVLDEEAPESNKPKKVNPKVTAPAEAETSSEEASQAATAPPNNGEVVIISETETEQGEAVEPEYVTVQVGVFLDEKDASRLLKQMENKGYSPTFFSGRDAEARQWYAVRIGVYSDKEQATKAAANFTKQERIKAMVRPVESL
jgi:cell division septation protein DedD